jgi:hypothetical protein
MAEASQTVRNAMTSCIGEENRPCASTVRSSPSRGSVARSLYVMTGIATNVVRRIAMMRLGPVSFGRRSGILSPSAGDGDGLEPTRGALWEMG